MAHGGLKPWDALVCLVIASLLGLPAFLGLDCWLGVLLNCFGTSPTRMAMIVLGRLRTWSSRRIGMVRLEYYRKPLLNLGFWIWMEGYTGSTI